ncbi:MAG TPA: hypothetical protein VKX40_14010 [Aequorivita sp.]|nr:hypothetical protein [Aequorivita sp.]
MSVPLKCITVTEAKDLQDNWIATRAVQIERGMGSQDTREFLFSVEELQEFLNYVTAGSTTPNPGIRIYFAAYDNETSDKATVFLAPTNGTNAGAENNYNLRPFNRGIQGFPPKSY